MYKAGNLGRQPVPSVAFFTLGLIVLGTAAQAQQPSQEQIDGIRKNCRSDFLSKCSGVKPGGAEAFQCLKKNVATLSSGCQTAVNAVAGPAPASPPPAAVAPTAMPQPKQAAPEPAPQPATAAASPAPLPLPTAAPATVKVAPAAPVKPAAPKPVVVKPKPTPKPAVATAPPPAAPPPAAAPKLSEQEEQALVRETCRFDYLKFCRGVLMGGGRIIACLNGHAPQLSSACHAAIKVVNANR